MTPDAPGRVLSPETAIRDLAEFQEAVVKALNSIASDVRQLRLTQIAKHARAVPVGQAQALLGCGKTKVYKYIGTGQLTRAPKRGKEVMILMESIDALLADGIPAEPTRRRRKAQIAKPVDGEALEAEISALSLRFGRTG